jgi:hypothetical protein
MCKNQVSMAIYAHRERLFLFAAAPSQAHWQCSRQDLVLARWNARMTAFLETDEEGHIAFQVLPKAFGFGDFR